MYFYAPDGSIPNKLVSGKNQTYFFNITSGSKYIIINNLNFFGTTIYAKPSDSIQANRIHNIEILNNNFYYPSTNKRMLKITDPPE